MLRPDGAAGEAPVGEQRAGFTQPFGFQVRRRVQHLLHAGAAFRTFVSNDDHVARDNLVGENARRAASWLSNTRARPLNFRMLSSTPGRLDDATVEAMLPCSTASPPSCE